MHKRTALKPILVLAVAALGAGCAGKEVKKEEIASQAQPAPQPASKPEQKPAPKAPAEVREESVAQEPVRPARDAGTDATADASKGRTAPAAQAELKFDTLYFDYDSFVLSKEAREQLGRIAEALRKNGTLRIRIAGYSDERGSDEYNLALGERRAKSVLDYLVGLGFAQDRFDVISYGEENPADAGHTEEAWARNRRAELTAIR